MTNPNQPPQLRERYEAYRQRFITSFDQAANQLPQRSGWLPAPLQQRVVQQPKLALTILVGIVLLLVLLFARPLLSAVVLLVLRLLFLVIYFGSWFWLFRIRTRRGVNKGKAIVFSAIAFSLLFFIPFLPHIILLLMGRNWGEGEVRRGASLTPTMQLQDLLHRRQTGMVGAIRQPFLHIAGVDLPNYLETLGFFFVGSPGSGKTQAIKWLLAMLKQRSDFRVIVLDRNGELLETFYEEGLDLLFNPRDARATATAIVPDCY